MQCHHHNLNPDDHNSGRLTAATLFSALGRLLLRISSYHLKQACQKLLNVTAELIASFKFWGFLRYTWRFMTISADLWWISSEASFHQLACLYMLLKLVTSVCIQSVTHLQPSSRSGFISSIIYCESRPSGLCLHPSTSVNALKLYLSLASLTA